MVFFVCSCGLSATKIRLVADTRLCSLCGSGMVELVNLPLSFWNKRRVFLELSEDDLFKQEKQVLEAIKFLNNPSDRDIAVYLGIERSSVNGRRNRLMNASIPFIHASGTKIDEKTNKTVTTWSVCKESVRID